MSGWAVFDILALTEFMDGDGGLMAMGDSPDDVLGPEGAPGPAASRPRWYRRFRRRFGARRTGRCTIRHSTAGG